MYTVVLDCFSSLYNEELTAGIVIQPYHFEAYSAFLWVDSQFERSCSSPTCTRHLPIMAGLRIVKGDLFTSPPPHSILLHACNALGSWGGGIALAFKKNFPSAYQSYKSHCDAHEDDPRKLIGTCLIIPGEEYDVGCLFTSVGYGRRVDPPAMILDATRKAVRDLMRQTEGNEKEIHSWCVPLVQVNLKQGVF